MNLKTNKTDRKINRQNKLNQLLEPITWDMSSPIYVRQRIVNDRRREVVTVYPFLTIKEQKQASKWLKAETHCGLWD